MTGISTRFKARFLASAVLFAVASSLIGDAGAQDEISLGRPLKVLDADPRESGEGTVSYAVAWILTHGRSPVSDADITAKAAANHAADLLYGRSIAETAPADLSSRRRNPRLVFAPFKGQADAFNDTDTAGAIGTQRFIEIGSRRFGIYNRSNRSLIAANTLNNLFGTSGAIFDPQVIWDPTTNRFYYAGDIVLSASDHRLAFGFSKTAAPNNGGVDFCHYTTPFGGDFETDVRLGDSQNFLIIGSTRFRGARRLGSDATLIRKPPLGTTCPPASALTTRIFGPLTSSSGESCVGPTPANQIDPLPTGFAVCRNGTLPSNRITILPFGQSGDEPTFLGPRNLFVPNYALPPDALQPGTTQKLDTGDGRFPNAISARNPVRNNRFSLWTGHTVADAGRSGIRFYEINPLPVNPVLLRTGTIPHPNVFNFNPAISPDRARTGTTGQFGGSFLIGYNESSGSIFPRIEVAGSLNGGPLGSIVIRNGNDSFQDPSCAAAGSTCRWGDYAGASPDPLGASGRGDVWFVNQIPNPNTFGLSDRLAFDLLVVP